MAEVVCGCGYEGGELEAEALHVQPPVLLHVLALHLAAAALSYPAGACGVSVAPAGRHGSSGYSAGGLPPALHCCAESSCWAKV